MDRLAELRSMAYRYCEPRPLGPYDANLYVGYVLIDGSGFVNEITDEGVIFGLVGLEHCIRMTEMYYDQRYAIPLTPTTDGV